MKAYLSTTGTLFGLLALLHLFFTIREWSQLASNFGLIVQGPGIGILAAGLCFWAMCLLRLPADMSHNRTKETDHGTPR